MQVLAGKFKGRKLHSFKAGFIRPMTNRVKKSLFDSLSPCFAGLKPTVLDLFSGTGHLAIEALSRGAYSAVLVDSHKKAIQLIKKNCELLHIKPALHRRDVFSFLSSYHDKPFELIFADPPFAKYYGERVLRTLMASSALKKGSVLAIELSLQEPDPPSAVHLLFAKKEFGDKKLLFYRF